MNWRETLISPLASIKQVIEIIDASALQIALVIDKNERLLGTVTDGDIRRGILKGIALSDTVSRIMNSRPTVAKSQDSHETVLAIMRLKQLRHIPLVDDTGRVVNMETWVDLLPSQDKDNWVVLMAGGMGTRLRPLTDTCPKPLLKIGSKPILETILESFTEHGFRKFYIAVNYMAQMIEDYFGTGEKWGVEIRYIREQKQLGTAGALSLLSERPRESLLVMNGDLLTKVNFHQLLEFHHNHQAKATMCVREYDFQVPFGVAKMEKHRLIHIEEKPVQHLFVNAGIYVLEPDTLDLIPHNTPFDMPDLFNKLAEYNCESTGFPIREYWIDIGRMTDFERANLEFTHAFSLGDD